MSRVKPPVAMVPVRPVSVERVLLMLAVGGLVSTDAVITPVVEVLPALSVALAESVCRPSASGVVV